MPTGTSHHRALTLAVAAALLVAGTLGLSQHSAAHADIGCDTDIYQTCWGPSFLQSAVGPGKVVLDWSFSIDTPQQVAIQRDHTALATLDVSTDANGNPDSPTQYTDTSVAPGAGYLYTVCFTYINSDPGCDDIGAGPVPGPDNPANGNSGSGGSASGGQHAPAPQAGLYSIPLALTDRSETSLTVQWSWGDQNSVGSSVEIVCVDLKVGSGPCDSSTPDSGGGYHKITNLPQNGTYTFTGLTPGHSYQMTACQAVGSLANPYCGYSIQPGHGDQYNPIFMTLLRPAAIAPSNLSLVKQTGDTAALIAFDPGSGGDELQIACTDLTANKACTPYAVADDATSAQLSGLTDGHDYSVTVAQVQLSDDASPPSISAPLTIHIVKVSPPTPTDLYVGDRSATELTLVWTGHADQATGVVETDVYRDGVKLDPPPASDPSVASIRQNLSYASMGRSFFVDITVSPADVYDYHYVVCNVYQQYRGTADEKSRTSCSAPLDVVNFTIDPNVQIKPNPLIPTAH